MQLRGALCIQRLLVERLLRLAHVVQEVDVALLQSLSRLAQCTLLHAELAKLTGKSAKALCLLLANAELLCGQAADTLAKALELLRLLAVDACCCLSRLVAGLRLLHHQVGDVLVDRSLLARQCAALGRHVAVLLCCLQVLTSCALAQLCLLHAELAKALARTDLLLCQVAIQACRCLADLCLLGCLRAHLLADVGQLTSTCLAKLCPLCFQRTELTARLQAETGLLRCQLSGLLAQLALGLRLLAVHAANALHELGLLSCLANLCLLQLRHLHGCLCIKTCLLELLLRRLKAQLALLACRLGLHLTGLCELLRGTLAKACLLRCNLRLLCAQLANALTGLHLALLLLFKGGHGSRLCLAVALRHEVGDGVGLLLQHATLEFSTLNPFALTTKRA